jgi:hypothetical protein
MFAATTWSGGAGGGRDSEGDGDSEAGVGTGAVIGARPADAPSGGIALAIIGSTVGHRSGGWARGIGTGGGAVRGRGA